MALSTYFFGKALLQSYGIMLRLTQRHSCKVMALGSLFERHSYNVMALDTVFVKLKSYSIRCNYQKGTLTKLWR